MSKPKPAPPAAPSEPDARDAARALLSMLEAGGAATPADMPEAQMRRLARDLIAQVEQRPRPDPAETAAPPPARRTLFSRIAPLTVPFRAPDRDTSPAAVPEAAPAPTPEAGRQSEPVPEAPRPLEAVSRPRPSAAAPSPDDLPVQLAVSGRSQARGSTLRSAILPKDRVRRLALQGIERGDGEHPAIVALTLQGRPPLDQAAALRALPRGQARAVHRALRMLPAVEA